MATEQEHVNGVLVVSKRDHAFTIHVVLIWISIFKDESFDGEKDRKGEIFRLDRCEVLIVFVNCYRNDVNKNVTETWNVTAFKVNADCCKVVV